MAKIKLTKSAVDAAQAQTCDVELRDTIVPGFLCKVTPTGRKVFMLQYRTNSGVRRKPALGQFGELTVEQARSLAQDWLAEVRRGGDPGHDKAEARKAPTVKELCGRFMEDHSKVRNKPSTQDSYQYQIDKYIVPAFGTKKAHEVTRHDITALMKRMEKSPTQANRVLACMRKMFNLAELWGYRPDGSNPCRHVSKYPEKGSTRLITDEQMVKLFAYLDKAEAEELEHPTYLLAIRLQFEFAARMSEILLLQWDWLDLPNSRVVWPDSKTGDMSKPLSAEARLLLENAPRYGKSLGFPLISIDITEMTLDELTPEWAQRVLTATTRSHEQGRRQTYIYLHDLLYPLYAQLPAFLDDEQRHQFLVFADDETLSKLVRWMNLLAEKLEYPKGTVAVALVNGKNEQSRKMLERAGQVVGPDWNEFNGQRCLRLTMPRPKGPADLQAHRFHMTMARILLSHTDALVGYKYCNGVDNNHPEEDVWVAHRWIADLNTHTQHRVLPKRLAEPINRLIAVVSDLHRNHTVTNHEA